MPIDSNPWSDESALPDLEGTIQSCLTRFKEQLWVAIPVVVDEFDIFTQTVKCTPTIRQRVPNYRKVEYVDLPQLIYVPAFVYSGGGYYITMPISNGDHGLVVFSSRAIDSWWETAATQSNPVEWRVQDISDGFYFGQFLPKPKAVFNYNPLALEVRDKTGLVSISLSPLGVVINGPVTFTGPVNMPLLNVATTAVIGGDLTVFNATGSPKSLGNIISLYDIHTHPDPQGGSVGPPVPQI